MSQKANPAVIGFFVIGAAIVAVGTILVLGSGEAFSEKINYVMYFEEDMSGLDIGAPVEYRGVQIGRVVDIKLVSNLRDHSILIPVVIEFKPNSLTYVGGDKNRKNHHEDLQEDIQKGLRAQLGVQSFITGKLKINIMYDLDKPVHLLGEDSPYPEIPTVKTTMGELAQGLEDQPFSEIINDAHDVINGISEIINNSDTRGAISSMSKSMGELEVTLQNMNGMLNEQSPMRVEISEAIAEFSESAKSIRVLTDYLARHPESLLHGKGK